MSDNLNQNGISRRKQEHIELCLEQASNPGPNPFDRFRVRNLGLPQIALEDVQTQTEFLNRPVSAPLIIESMTGGCDRGGKINRNLAVAANEFHIPLFLGSARAALLQPELMDTYQVRSRCPSAPIFANIGAGDLGTLVTLDDCRKLVETLEADGLVLHLNPLQEALQPEGNPDFRGKLELIFQAAGAFDFPVIVKEVGHGLDPVTVLQLQDAGVSAVDVAGSGGTSFAAVECARSHDPAARSLAAAFAGFGLTTPMILERMDWISVHIPVIASGGIRNGVDAFKSLCLGARFAGVAGALLAAADSSEQRAVAAVGALIKALRVTMFCAGCRSLKELSPLLLVTDD